VESNHRL